MPVLDLDDGDWIAGDYGALRAIGLYAALLERERRSCSRPDPRLMRLHHTDGAYCTTPGVVCEHEPLPLPQTPLRNDLEAGRPVVLEGRQLKGNSLPDAHLRRDQAFDWFEVRPDDTVRPAPKQ